MNIYSIGFTQKTAEEFFSLLKENNVKKLIDIRLNRESQLSVFARYPDIEYFLKLHGIEYVYYDYLAPTEDLRKRYNDKKSEKKMTFSEYTVEFHKILDERNAIVRLIREEKELDNACFMCSEDLPEECHRYLTIQRIIDFLNNIKFPDEVHVKHLVSYKALNQLKNN